MNTSLEIYFCGREQCAAGHSFGPAVRPHYLIHFILSGKGRYHVNGNAYHLQAGDAFLIYPGETTFYEADEKTPWEYAWIGFGGESCRALLSSCAFSENGYIFRQASAAEYEKNTGAEKSNSFADTTACLDKMIHCFVSGCQNSLELLGYFYLILSRITNSSQIAQTSPEELYLQKALDYIHNNYGYPIYIQNLSRQIGIDRSYLYKLMERKFHLSPQQYLIEYRLTKAREMLKNTSLSITEITFSCGFKDTSSFCRIFKKRTGISPGMFRKNPSAYQLSD